jgi:hypothetical protein
MNNNKVCVLFSSRVLGLGMPPNPGAAVRSSVIVLHTHLSRPQVK